MTKAEIKALKEENMILRQAVIDFAEKWSQISQGEITTQCSICFQPYVYYPRIVGDQNACSECKKEARRV